MLEKIVEACLKEKFSAQSVAFGMGGGLLQKVNRDTMSFATKLSHIHLQGQPAGRDLMKAPKTDLGKFSLPGLLQVSVRGRHRRKLVWALTGSLRRGMSSGAFGSVGRLGCGRCVSNA